MHSPQLMLLTACAALLLLNSVSAGNGYYYDRPVLNSPKTGHIFQPLATVLPLPPVPALPPLPTPRPRSINSIAAAYLPAQNTPPNQYFSSPALSLPPRQTTQYQTLQQQPHVPTTYLAPTPQRPLNEPRPVYRQQTAPRFDLRANVPPTAGSLVTFPAPNTGSRFFGPSAPTAGGFAGNTQQANSAPSAPSGPANTQQAAAQPLRIPFGKAAVITLPNADNNDIYLGPKGRQLKQYAVIEIIDNDIAQTMEPFLPAGYFDSVRAQIGATGTGATSADTGAVQFESRIGALVQQQQQQQQRSFSQQQQQQQQQRQNGRSSTADSISLGSGGLGYVRLPNGNVYLGSGSLGYISDQQHQQFIQEARTRTGARQPDPLHFGHGPLGGTGNGFSFRFK